MKVDLEKLWDELKSIQAQEVSYHISKAGRWIEIHANPEKVAPILKKLGLRGYRVSHIPNSIFVPLTTKSIYGVRLFGIPLE